MASLPEVLRDRVLPKAHIEPQLVVAQSLIETVLLPPAVQATPQELQGRRVLAKGRRFPGEKSVTSAYWPQAHLIEKRVAQLICMVEGEAFLPFGRYALTCGEGTFVFVPPGVPHPMGQGRPHLTAAAQRSGAYCNLMWFGKWGHSIRCWLCHSRGRGHTHNREENYFLLSPRAVALFDLLTEEAMEQASGYEQVCADLLTSFLTTAHWELLRKRFVHPGVMGGDEEIELAPLDRSEDAIELAQSYVRTHLSRPLTIEDVARHVYLSRAQFTSRFRAQTGQTFLRYLTACRLEEAQRLLRETQLSVAMVCLYTGLSASQFHTIFRRHTGLSPQEFRRTHQNKSDSGINQPNS
jgi:AraC-like DNA-binding protein